METRARREWKRENPEEIFGVVVQRKLLEGESDREQLIFGVDGKLYPYDRAEIKSAILDLRAGQTVKFVPAYPQPNRPVATGVRRIVCLPSKEWLAAVNAVRAQNGKSGYLRGKVVASFSRDRPDRNGQYGFGYIEDSTAEDRPDIKFRLRNGIQTDAMDVR